MMLGGEWICKCRFFISHVIGVECGSFSWQGGDLTSKRKDRRRSAPKCRWRENRMIWMNANSCPSVGKGERRRGREGLRKRARHTQTNDFYVQLYIDMEALSVTWCNNVNFTCGPRRDAIRMHTRTLNRKLRTNRPTRVGSMYLRICDHESRYLRRNKSRCTSRWRRRERWETEETNEGLSNVKIS